MDKTEEPETLTRIDVWAEWDSAWAALATEIRKPFAWLLDRLAWILR